MPVVKVSERTRERLVRIKGLLEATGRKTVSMDEVISGLLDRTEWEFELREKLGSPEFKRKLEEDKRKLEKLRRKAMERLK